MHVIEQLFGLAPDGGNGVLEVFLLVLPLVVAFWLLKRTTLFKHAS
jgi:hypothetical protein